MKHEKMSAQESKTMESTAEQAVEQEIASILSEGAPGAENDGDDSIAGPDAPQLDDAQLEQLLEGAADQKADQAADGK